jgi:TFIIH basal transcription factor complex TTD-A subunit
MVRTSHGPKSIIESFQSDSAVKQILLTMNEKENFIIEDLDDFHLVIKADQEQRVRAELDNEVYSYPCPRHPWI